MLNQSTGCAVHNSGTLVASREVRIFGPPGCGKTTTIKRLVIEKCKEYGSESILIASFTKTAARQVVSQHLPVDDQQIGTLHAHAFRALDRPKLVNKPALEEWNRQYPTRPFADGFKALDLDDPYKDQDQSALQQGDALLQKLNLYRGLLTDREGWPLSLQSFHEDWTAFKQSQDLLDFTDLIEICYFDQAPIPRGARVLFLDEAQDFSPLELALARQWGESCDEFFLAADDDQTLYAFKGADPQAFLTPALPPEQVRVLEQSYRVPRAVHALACSWVEQLTLRQPKVYRPRDFEGTVDRLPVTYKYLASLRDPLAGWLKDKKTVALLASCSYMVDPIKHQLRAWGIPFHNPWRRSRGDWNPLLGKKDSVSAAQRVLAYLRPSRNEGWWTYRDLWDWAGVIESERIFAHGAKTAMRRKAEDELTSSQPVETSDLEAWIVDVQAPQATIAGDLAWYQAHLLKSAQRPIAYACSIVEACGVEALTKEPQTVIGTIHSVKGGECDVVILFPDLSRAGFEEWCSPGVRRDSIVRMFYVGMTRAKESLYLADAASPVAVVLSGGAA
jgi:superfamily I DNA/RNA helicase